MLLDDSQVANVEIYPPGVPSIPCFFIIIIVIVIIIFFFKLVFFSSFQNIIQKQGFGSKIGIVQPVPRATRWCA